VEEVKALRAKHVNVSDKVIKAEEYFEVTGFKSVQVGSCMHAPPAASSIHRPFVMHAMPAWLP
jgi:hypothetical protein